MSKSVSASKKAKIKEIKNIKGIKINVATLPDSAPVLSGKHFCRGAEKKGKRHCAIGWMSVTFGKPDVYGKVTEYSDYPNEIEKLFVKNAKSMYPAEFKKYAEDNYGDDIRKAPAFNDEAAPTLDDVAAVWNRTMSDLGYTAPVFTRLKK